MAAISGGPSDLTSEELELRLLAGFIIILSSAAILNKVGDFLYHRGVAKPFYLRGHRLHHRSFLLTIVPASYVVIATLIYFHYVGVMWSSFWPSAEITLLLAATCLTFDLVLDAISNREKRMALLHHEWVYLLVPAYAFTHLIVLI
jgi:hypothetical protein